MTKQTKTLNRLLRYTQPSGRMKEYHGNGKNAWMGATYYARCCGHNIKAVQVSRRYSYRYHKTETTYYLDGESIYHRSTFKAALRKLGIAV